MLKKKIQLPERSSSSLKRYYLGNDKKTNENTLNTRVSTPHVVSSIKAQSLTALDSHSV